MISVLDIGSSKISCLCLKETLSQEASIQYASSYTVIGASEEISEGISYGVITDVQTIKNRVHSVIQTIEKKINKPIDSLWVNVSPSQIENHYIQKSILIDHTVSAEDMDHLQSIALKEVYKKYDFILHAAPIHYSLDGEGEIYNPLNMKGKSLEINILVITAHLVPVRQIMTVLEKCNISPKRCVLTGISSALGSLVPSELKMGAIAIDIGAEMTSLTVLHKDRVIFTDMLKMGGNLITQDIAKYFSIPLATAETLKKTKGTCQVYGTEYDQLEIPVIGENFHTPTFETIARTELVHVIQARIEEIFTKVHKRLRATGLLKKNYRIVLTGGTSNLSGIDAVCQDILGGNTRIAYPLRLHSMPKSMSSPAYSTLTGLVEYASKAGYYDLPLKKLSKRFYQENKSLPHKIIDWFYCYF